MAIFAITFRLEDNDTYADRYDSLITAIRKESPSQYWDEPTSFSLIEVQGSSSVVANRIAGNSDLDPDVDLLVVVNLTNKGFKAIGVVHDDDLDKLMAKR